MKLARSKILYEGRRNLYELNSWNVYLKYKIDVIF